ncbi:RNA-directed DNA polymerase [Weissella paramesenteroides]|uniref:RNA-directed DNA polymerase n=2 Tax=Weissella paramesenteroides TaxID=1249 RepID=UPI0023F70D5C|nr:RNA-directed DNA polymerase [Weissella paramesenteroides]MDF8372629.1 RNA-directed DNA polymerase [Weissella paramesenteroides]WIG66403.1 RNA-directed DNA polymerase [Weissella paramesenteroides]
MPNIYSYLQLAYYVTLNKNEFVDAFNENKHSTSKYFNQLKYNYTVTQKIREGQLADNNNILNMDLGNFYHSLYTHTISWMLMGRNESKKHRRGGFSNTLDHLIQQEQFGETYGVPVGNLISRIITELYMCNFDKQIDSAFEGGVRFTRYVDDFHYTFTNESQKDAFVQRFRFLCREYRLNVNEYKTKVDTFPYLTSLDKDSIFHYFDNKFQGEQISEKLLKQSIIAFIDLCLKEESQGNKGSIKSCFSVLNNFLEKIIKQKRLSKKSINALFTNDENLTNFNCSYEQVFVDFKI